MKKGSLFQKLFLFVSLIILILLSPALAREYFRKKQVNKEIYSLKEEIKKLEKDQNDFSELINYLNTEDFWEKEARSKLGLQKPGEKLVVIPNDYFKDEGNGAKDKKEISESAAEISNPHKWWNYFFNF